MGQKTYNKQKHNGTCWNKEGKMQRSVDNDVGRDWLNKAQIGTC